MSTEITDHPAPVIPWWTRGDTNAFFGLGFNILVNVLTLTGLMIGVVAGSRGRRARHHPACARRGTDPREICTTRSWRGGWPDAKTAPT